MRHQLAKGFKMSNIYYVYLYRDFRDGKRQIPIYVGMGKGKRAWQHLKRTTNKGLRGIINQAKESGVDLQPEIVITGLTKYSAFAKEVELIELYGRRDLGTGSLFNQTRGGDGAVELSDEALAKRNAHIQQAHMRPENRAVMSSRMLQFWASEDAVERKAKLTSLNTSEKGKANLKAAWAKKGGHSEEAKLRIGEASRQKMCDPEYKAAWLEKQRAACKTDTAKANKSAAVKAGWSNEETRRKRIEGIKAAHNSEEYRAKVSAQQALLWTDEAKKKASDFAKERLKDPLTKARSSVANAYTWAVRKGLPFSPVSFPRKSI